MEMVKAVPKGEELSWTMGGSWSWRARSSVMLRQMSPRPYRAMKLMESGVTWSAAMVRSPSFSRSSSSTRITIFPDRMSSSASSIMASVIWTTFSREPVFFEKILGDPRILAFQEPEDIFPDDVRFHVDPVPRSGTAKGGPIQGKRNQRHLEPVRMDRADREAHAVHSHGSIENNVFHYRGIGPYMEYPGIPRGPHFADRSGAVHVAVHQVTVQPSGNYHRPLQVHPPPYRQRTERRTVQRLWGDIRQEPSGPLSGDRKAGAGNRNGVARPDLLQRQPRGHFQDGAGPFGRERNDRSDFLHDARKHLSPRPRKGLRRHHKIVPRAADIRDRQFPASGHRSCPESRHRPHPFPQQQRGEEEYEPVDGSGGDQPPGGPPPSLHQEGRHTFLPQCPKENLRGNTPSPGWEPEHPPPKGNNPFHVAVGNAPRADKEDLSLPLSEKPTTGNIRQARGEDNTPGISSSRDAGREQRIVLSEGPPPDQHGVGFRTHPVGPLAGLLPADPSGHSRGGGNLSIQRHCEFQGDVRLPGNHPPAIGAVERPRLLLEKAVGHRNTRPSESRKPLAGDQRVRVLHGGRDPPDSRGQDRLGARTRATDMAARLQGHVKVGPRSQESGVPDRLHFRVGQSSGPVNTAADDFPAPDEDRSHRGVRRGPPDALSGEPEGHPHELGPREGHVRPSPVKRDARHVRCCASGGTSLAIRHGYPASSSKRAPRSLPRPSVSRNRPPSSPLPGTRGL